MEDLWSDADCGSTDALNCCAYGSRLLGGDRSLVLHGGGNTSVKADWTDVTGRTVDALYVKGSGWDLASIEVPGFTPLPLDRLHELLGLDALSDADMMAELSAARLNAAAPQPSVETLLHAYLPFRAVQHSHADVVLGLTNVADAEDTLAEVYGDDVVIVPYVMPGFDLAVAVRSCWDDQAHDGTVGVVLRHHGLFTFGDSTREAYAHHVDLISRAEAFLDRVAPHEPAGPSAAAQAVLTELADLRRSVSEAAGRPMVVSRHHDGAIGRFVARPDLIDLTGRGPLTPDHVIRTKRTPMVGLDVDGFVAAYGVYFERNGGRSDDDLTMLDPAPRVVLDPELGLLTAGATPKDADIAADIYRQTIPVLERLEDGRGGYVALDEGDLFDVEYWDLEQAKLRRAGAPKELAGHIALVTGAASGIGRACAAELLDRGAAVVGVDLSESVVDTFDGPAWLGVAADVSDHDAQAAALRVGVERFGGLDLVVVGAGIFPGSSPIADLDLDTWRLTMAVNVDSVAALFRDAAPLLFRSPVGGRVAVIASRNATAPGKGAAAYSTSKAALTQLARVAALEWAEHGVRVNVVHPDNVFDTALWTDELIAERSAAYGMTPEEYRRRNLLGMEVGVANVASVVAELCSDRFAATTGAQIPIDGGSERTI